MCHIMATIKVQVPVLDPDTRKLVGYSVQELAKEFDEHATIADIADWARSKRVVNVSMAVGSE